METYYNIHGKVKIKITTKFPEIIKDCEYSFGYFKVNDLAGPFAVEIRDFGEFLLPKNYTVISNVFFGFKNGILNKREDYAIQIKNDAIVIFIKENNLCINALIEFVLLKHGYSFIHAAGISYLNKGIIFPAGPNVGKTILMSALRKRPQVRFFGDDYVIVKDDKIMYSYPMDFSIYQYHFPFFPELNHSSEQVKIKRAIYERVLVNIVRNLPIKKWLKKVARSLKLDILKGGEYLKIPAKRLILQETFGQEAEIKYSVFLSKYSGNKFTFEIMELGNLAQEIIGILQSEWQDTLPVFHLLAMFGVIDYVDYLNSIKNVLKNTFGDAKLYKVLIPEAMNNEDKLLNLETFLEEHIFNR